MADEKLRLASVLSDSPPPSPLAAPSCAPGSIGRTRMHPKLEIVLAAARTHMHAHVLQACACEGADASGALSELLQPHHTNTHSPPLPARTTSPHESTTFLHEPCARVIARKLQPHGQCTHTPSARTSDPYHAAARTAYPHAHRICTHNAAARTIHPRARGRKSHAQRTRTPARTYVASPRPHTRTHNERARHNTPARTTLRQAQKCARRTFMRSWMPRAASTGLPVLSS
jgi:hypothetical protein